ncbi:homocysteine S-methyltransferase family protein [Alphaproteobacteria bacterium]|nr:homocysteine S-methyltransferase family protein [Alphaproteobacteria bacterium]MDC3311592.1 homocysteine S-methyltransferase family protein [Alphaproteobacteria bacterium]
MANIILLDGGLGQEIQKRSSSPKAHPLWSLQVMYDEPEIVVNVHYDFIMAGAKVICLNNYTATTERLKKHNYFEKFEETHKLAAKLSLQAIQKSSKNRNDIDIAGCLPPLVASYVASEALDFERSLEEYQKLISVQKDFVDLFLIETMSNITEAKAAISALKTFNLTPLVGITIADDLSNTLRSGEPLELAIEHLCKAGAAGLMINCSFPESIDYALPLLARSGLPFGAYANGFSSIAELSPGSTVDNLTARQDLSIHRYAEHVDKWIELGATIIGGCCEIGPDYISYLHSHLLQQGHHLISARQSDILF